jgi:hypothetical protein
MPSHDSSAISRVKPCERLHGSVPFDFSGEDRRRLKIPIPFLLRYHIRTTGVLVVITYAEHDLLPLDAADLMM